MESSKDDPFSRVNYRSLIAWPERIRREAPFIITALSSVPERSVADLGAGTGEHARFLAGEGYRVAGLDASESMVKDALEETLPANLRFLHGDMRDADRILDETFGGAICLGNTLPFMTGEQDLSRAFDAVWRLLLPGGVFLLQILNYEKLRTKKERHLPLNFNRGEEGEIVFLRLMEYRDHGEVLFFPTTLLLQPDNEEEPVRLMRTKRVSLRGWTRQDVVPALERAGFTSITLFGTMTGEPFQPLESPDLVVTAGKPRG
jgi:SAM-dependent methyltransferase